MPPRPTLTVMPPRPTLPIMPPRPRPHHLRPLHSLPPAPFTPPSNTWDSHLHVSAPRTSTPAAPSSNPAYTPSYHPLSSALAHASRHRLTTLVFVQPSTSGLDNTPVLAALAALAPANPSHPPAPARPAARGVIVLDPLRPPPPSTLHTWHLAGVRGIRLNLRSLSATPSPREFAHTLSHYAPLCRATGWALQLHIDLALAPALLSAAADLGGVRIVLDHFCGPPGVVAAGRDAGWDAVLRLLQARAAWVKVSGAYRVPGVGVGREERVEGMVRELLGVGGGRGVVWGSDWPHTRFETAGVDTERWMRMVYGWCAERGARERVFGLSARELWDGGEWQGGGA